MVSTYAPKHAKLSYGLATAVFNNKHLAHGRTFIAVEATQWRSKTLVNGANGYRGS